MAMPVKMEGGVGKSPDGNKESGERRKRTGHSGDLVENEKEKWGSEMGQKEISWG